MSKGNIQKFAPAVLERSPVHDDLAFIYATAKVCGLLDLFEQRLPEPRAIYTLDAIDAYVKRHARAIVAEGETE